MCFLELLLPLCDGAMNLSLLEAMPKPFPAWWSVQSISLQAARVPLVV